MRSHLWTLSQTTTRMGTAMKASTPSSEGASSAYPVRVSRKRLRDRIAMRPPASMSRYRKASRTRGGAPGGFRG